MKKLIAANWKMNKTPEEAVHFLREPRQTVKSHKQADVLVCPPFTSLHAAARELDGSGIMLGAQNMHYEDSGAFTGDISPLMVKEAGCKYVILGHSERREFFREDDVLINKKLMAALKHGLKPILCVGETFEEKSGNLTREVVEKQLRNGLDRTTKADAKHITIAYEPVWAISRGNPNVKSATPDDAEQMHKFVRDVLAIIYDSETADSMRILYGGSMKPENAKELLSRKGIDGGLVGNASLEAKSFARII